MLKAVIFDIDDTLYDQQIPFSTALTTYLSAVGPQIDLTAAFQQFGTITDQLFAKVAAGEWQLKQLQEYRFNAMLTAQGLPSTPTDHSIQFELRYQEAMQKIQLFPDLAASLTKLGQHYQIGIISNGPAEQQWAKIRQLHLDRLIKRQNIFISGEVGVAKPDPSIFTKFAHQIGIRASEAVYVGDNYINDISGAKGAGWQAFWFNHRKRQQPNDGPIPDQTVTSSAELTELLAALTEEQIFQQKA